MNRLIKIFVPLLVVLSLFSCIDDDDNDSDYEKGLWSEVEKLDQSKYYEFEPSEENGFDGVLYHDGIYIAYKTDVVNNVYVYYVSKKKISQRDGVFVVLNFDGTLFAFGKPDRIMYACGNDDGSLSLIGTKDNNELKLNSFISASKQLARQRNYKVSETSQGYDPKSWIKVGLGEVPYLGDLIGIYDLGKAWNDHDSFQMATNVFTSGVSYLAPGGVSIVINVGVNEWEQQCQELLWRLYGNARVEIDEVIPVGNNKYEVVVKIQNAQDLSKSYTVNIEDNFGCRVASVPRETYLAVCGSSVENGDIDLAYTISDEALVENKDGDDEMKMTIIINIPKGKLVYLRPYLISYMRLTSSQPVFTNLIKLFKKQYLYGSDFPYVNGGVDLSWKLNYLKGESNIYDNKESRRTIEAQIEVHASRPKVESSDVAVVDWGYVLIDKEGNISHSYSFFENNDNEVIYETEVSRTIEYWFNEDELVVDEFNYTASLEGYQICSYIKFVNPNNWIPIQEELYGMPMDFGFRYSSAPSFTFVDTEYFGSYVRNYSPWAPILINPEEKIYANCQTEYSMTAEVKGAFFIKEGIYKEYGTNKYCFLFNGITMNYFEDGEYYDNVNFLWRSGDFSNNNKMNYHLEYIMWNGNTGRSNAIYLNPVRNVNDDGEVYYFGFSPSLL